MRQTQLPPTPERTTHDSGSALHLRRDDVKVAPHILAVQMRNDVRGLDGRKERDAGAVAVEAEVAVVGHDVDGAVPRDLVRRGGTGTGVVDCADVEACEAEAWAGTVH